MVKDRETSAPQAEGRDPTRPASSRSRDVTSPETAPLFVGALRHGLAQPLNALMLLSDFAPTKGTTADLELWQARVRRSIEGLDRMVRVLGEVARLDLTPPRVAPRAIACQSLLAELIRSHGAEAQRRSIATRLVATRLMIFAAPELVAVGLDALMDNALRHSGARRLLCGARPRGNQVALGVWDAGRGLSSAGLDLATRDFTRSADLPDVDRSPDSSGLGLGLGIAARIARLSGGRLKITARPGHGTAALLLLPRATK